MSSLMQEMNQTALELGVPLSVHLDVTYRCNERCVHCYLDHEDHGEMTTAELTDVLDQLSRAGTFFLSISGGEIFLRKDLFEIVAYARRLCFNVKLKTNAMLVRAADAERLKALGVEQIQVSIYSHRPEVHDAITKVKGSLERSLRAIRLLRAKGLKVSIANVLMRQNMFDDQGVRALAAEVGAAFTIDPTITPMMDGGRGTLALNIPRTRLREVFHDETLVGDVAETCAPPPAPTDAVLGGIPCSAGHTACYISPYGDVYPCVQFPLPSGNVRRQRFIDIWRSSPELQEVRSIRARDLATCTGCAHLGTCSRCPGLAYMEGDMRGPSTLDCEKSLARTGIPSANMRARAAARHAACPDPESGEAESSTPRRGL